MPSPPPREVRSTVAERYRVLLETGRTLAGTLSTEELYAAIYRETTSVLEAAGFYIALYDQGRDLARIVYYVDQGEVREPDVVYRGSDSEVLRTRRACVVNRDLTRDCVMVLGEEDSEVAQSAVAAPLIHKGRLLGAISAQSYRPDAYNEDDLALLQGIADIAAVAIDNALQFEELQKRRREAEKIEEIGRALTSELDPKEVLDKVIDAVLDVLDVDAAGVWLCDGPEETVVTVAASGGAQALPEGLKWRLEGSLEEQMIRERKPVVIDNLENAPAVPEAVRRHIRTRSGIGAPLEVSGRVVGVLTAASVRPRAFNDDDAAVLQRLASQASVALENARLHANLQALSLTDPLTGLPNRRRLQIHLDKEVAAARRGRKLVTVVFDLDDFKKYNDTHGHVVGDDILRAFAQILDDENRAMNLVARYGGDEFVSVLSETHMEGARQYVERVSQRVKEDPILSQYGVTVSSGLAEFDRTSMKSMEELLQAADLDMYASKSQRPGSRRAATN